MRLPPPSYVVNGPICECDHRRLKHFGVSRDRDGSCQDCVGCKQYVPVGVTYTELCRQDLAVLMADARWVRRRNRMLNVLAGGVLVSGVLLIVVPGVGLWATALVLGGVGANSVHSAIRAFRAGDRKWSVLWGLAALAIVPPGVDVVVDVPASLMYMYFIALALFGACLYVGFVREVRALARLRSK